MSAGSGRGVKGGIARIFPAMRGRKADATVAAPPTSEGSSASVVGLLAVVVTVGALVLPAGALAEPLANLGSFGTMGTQGGQLSDVTTGIAANRSGDGAPAGSVYVSELQNHRISQFSASGEFVRTWGFDVVDGVNHPAAPNDNGTAFEICDVTAGNSAEQCKAGVAGGGAGQLSLPGGISVDQSNGYLYVINSNNLRVDVFSGSGQFAGAFGYDVRPSDPNPSGPDFCTASTGCQAASSGGTAGRFGELAAAYPAVDPSHPGRVYVPDRGNLRVAHYETTVAGGVLTDVSFVKAFGSDVVSSGPGNRTVSRNERQSVAIFGGAVFTPSPSCPAPPCAVPVSGGTFTLRWDSDGAGPTPPQTTTPIPYDASAATVQQRLVDDHTAIAPGDVSVSGGPGPDTPWIVDFGGTYAAVNVATLSVQAGGLTPAGSFASVTTPTQGGVFPAGYEVCVPADGDVCKQGVSGNGAGEFNSGHSPTAVGVDSIGAIYATSGPLTAGTCSAATPCRIQKFSPDASSASDFGPASGPGQLTFTSGAANAVAALNIAVDPTNDHVFVLRKEDVSSWRVLEYDSAGTHVDTHPAGPALHAAFTSTIYTGIALGTEGRVYAAHGGGGTVLLLGPIEPPTVAIASPTDVGSTTATFSGTVEIPSPGSPVFDTRYRFEYSRNGVDWTAIPSPDANVGDGSTGAHTVTQTVTGLDPNTLYSVRLVATTGPSATSSAVSFMTDGASPRVALSFVDEVTQTTARLGAHIDPEGAKTTYRFEWGSQPCSTAPGACASVPAFERQLGSDNQVLIANEPIDGLKPATTYHYRVIATNASGTTTGPDQRFETLNDCNLTDGRCYEMVSPPDKGPVGAAGDVVSLGAEIAFQAAEDRPALAYTLAYGLPDGTAGEEALFQSNRTESGWSSMQLEAPTVALRDSPGATSNTSNTKGLSLNLDCGVFSSNQPLGDNPPAALLEAGSIALYSRSSAGTWTPLTDIVPSNPLHGNGLAEFALVGMSQDQPCARAVFMSGYTYPGVDGAGSSRLYWWENGVLGYVGVIPGPCPGGGCVAEAVPGTPDVVAETSLGVSRNFHNAVSRDGSRVFFTAFSQQGGDAGQRALFMRDRGSPIAVDVSQSQTGALPGGTVNDEDAVYQTASVDGSKVFFTGRYGLASNEAGDAVHSSTGATACADDGAGCDLYEFDVASGKLTDLSVPHPGVSTNTAGASVAGVVAADDDGSHVYLAARGKLAPGEGATEGRNLADGTYNLYLAHDGSFSYVGRIGDGVIDVRRALVGHAHGETEETGYWASRVSADGGRLLFLSSESLTDYDTDGHAQAYLYDAASGTTVCVSCRRDGGAPSEFPAALVNSSPLLSTAHTPSSSPPRTLSDDGRRVFFISTDYLATGATQGRMNLYQWEEGQVSFLASSGPTTTTNTTGLDMRFGGSSADGDDVYFSTVDKYTWQDQDFKLDIYDARVGGGFDAPPPAEAPCDPLVGRGCQQGGSAPSVGAPVETREGGAGNPPASPRATFSVSALSARQLRLLAAGRRVGVRVRVSRAGRVSMQGRARIGRFAVTVMSGSRRVSRGGPIRVGVRLSKAARGRIASGRSLAVTLTVRFTGARRAAVRRLAFESSQVHEQRTDIRRSARSRAATNNRRAAK